MQLKGEISGEVIFLTVQDNGMGMEDESLRSIQGSLSGRRELTGRNRDRTVNIGLANVNNRIKLNYGNEYGIMIKSEAGIGTEVVIKMPFRGDGNV